MAKTAAWDDAFLKQCEESDRNEALDALSDADWRQARRQLFQELSDTFAGFVTCPSAKCRRARRCVGDGPACCAQLRIGIPADVEQNLCDEIYRELQEARRDAERGVDTLR